MFEAYWNADLPVFPHVMRPRCAVPKIPTKSFVPPRLPFHNSHVLLNRSKSTLAEALIPLHFNSFRISVYKKAGEELALSGTKFCNSSLPTNHPAGHAGSATTPIPSRTSAHFPSPMGCTPLAHAHSGSNWKSVPNTSRDFHNRRSAHTQETPQPSSFHAFAL